MIRVSGALRPSFVDGCLFVCIIERFHGGIDP